MSQVPAIRGEHISFRYLEQGTRILEDVSITIPREKITVLMGSSGCGKSTLASVLCGLFPENGGVLESGEIYLCGDFITNLSVRDRAKRISMMFQNPDLQFCMATLREELYFCMENYCISPNEMEEKAIEAAKIMGTNHLLDQNIYSLSGGEKQRALLTCIYLMDAECIFLDEPFANLDPDGVQDLMGLLKDLCCKHKKTIIAIDHMSDHWQGIADRFVILKKKGQVLCEIEDPRDLPSYQALFLKEGIAYPGIWKKKEITLQEESKAILSFKNFSLPRIPEKTKKSSFLFFQKKKEIKKKTDYLLEDTTFHIPEGRISAILGKSGSGKSSLLMTLLKQRSYQGSILLTCKDLPKEYQTLSQKECFKHLSIAFQNPSNQFVSQNVMEEVSDGLRRLYPKKDKDEISSLSLKLLKTCKLEDYQNYSPYMLSQGQQRRLAVLSVLSGGQKILLLDEPTYGQDYRSAKALMDQVSKEVLENKITVLMTTHDRGLAAAYADHIFVLKDKKIKEVSKQ